MRRLCNTVVLVLALALCAVGQSAKPKRPSSGEQIVAQEVVISGTSTLSSEQLKDISGSLTSVTMSDDEEEVDERVRDQFQQRGYFDAEVTNLKIVPLDPLAKKKPVRIEAEVSEGQLFRLAVIQFTGNKTLSTDEIRSMFPLHKGDVFSTDKIRMGLDALLPRYLAIGFLEPNIVPKTEKSGSAQITLTFDVGEGIQYRMGELKINGKNEAAQELQARWKLKPGELYDYAYLEKFLAQNKELFPEGFNDDRDVLWLRDCSDNTINVTIELDPKRQWKPKPQDKPCEAVKDKKAGQ